MRSAPAMSTTATARSAGCVSEQAETILDQLTARGRCNQIAARAVDSVRHATYTAAIAHRALTPPQKRIETAPETRLVTLGGCSGWQDRNAWWDATPLNVLVVFANHLSVLATNSACPPVILRLCAADDDSEIRSQAAHNSACPPDVLRRLASDAAPSVRGAVAARAVASPDVLEMLGEDSNSGVREEIVKNPASSPGTLLRLADGDVFRVGTALAANPAATPEMLARLSGWALWAVRAAAAARVECPAEALRTLSADPYSTVRHQVARNAATSAGILHQLGERPRKVRAHRRKVASEDDKLLKRLIWLAWRWPTIGRSVRLGGVQGGRRQPCSVSDDATRRQRSCLAVPGRLRLRSGSSTSTNTGALCVGLDPRSRPWPADAPRRVVEVSAGTATTGTFEGRQRPPGRGW